MVWLTFDKSDIDLLLKIKIVYINIIPFTTQPSKVAWVVASRFLDFIELYYQNK